MTTDRKKMSVSALKVLMKIRNFMLSKQSREFLIFLFFVALSTLFWLLQVLNNDYETDIRVPVKLKNVPAHVEIEEEMTDAVVLHVKDRGTVLANYLWGKTFLPITIDFNSVANASGHVALSSQKLSQRVVGQLGQTTKLLSVKPDSLTFSYTAVRTKRVQAVRPQEVTEAEITVEVPVKGVNFPADKVLRTFPSKVQVTCQVDMEDVRRVKAEDFFVAVAYEDLLKLGMNEKCEVTLKVSPDFVNHPRLNPTEVDYLIEQHSDNHD